MNGPAVPGKEHEAQSSTVPQIERANGGAFSQAAGSSFVSVTGRNLWHKRKGRGRASNKTAADNSTSNESLTAPEILQASGPSEAFKSDELDPKHTTRPTANPSTHQPVHQPTHESSHDTSNDSSYDNKPTNQPIRNNIIKAAVSHWIRFTRVRIALRARNEKLKRDTLLQWRGYRLMRWRQNIRATVQHRMATCLVFWRVWNMRIQIAKLDQANMETAKSRGDFYLIVNSTLYSTLIDINDTANLTLVRTTLNYWLMYNDHRRIQNLKKRFALNSRESMLSTRVFKLWRDKFRFRRHIQLLDQQSIHCESARISKSHFSHWLSALRKRRELDAKVDRMKARLDRISLDQTFSAWKEFLRAMKRKHDMREIAEGHLLNHVRTVCMDRWKFRYASKIRQAELQQIAKSFCRNTKLKFVFQSWMKGAELSRQNRVNGSIAAAHQIIQLKKRTLQHLSILKGWRVKAEIFHDNLTAQQAFQHWKMRYHTSVHAREALILLPAVDHHKNQLLRQCLKSWIDYTNKEKSEKELERRAIEWDRKCILNSTFKHISRKYTFNAIKRKMEILAHENWKFSVLEKLFHHWMESCQERFRDRLHSKKIERFRKQLLTRRYFEALAKNADVAFMERQKEVLQAWQIYTSDRVMLKAQIDIRVSEIQSLLSAARVRRFFRQWIIYHGMMAAKALKKASADLICVDSTRRKAFGVWKSRLAQSLALKRNTSLADDHFNSRLMKCSFGRWLQPKGVNIDWKATYAARHITPVLHWSQTLSRSVFRAWRAQSKQEKQNAALLQEARGWKQEIFTRDGVMYWMLGADVVRKVREGYQAAESFRTNQLELKKVKKFALRWRAKTAASKKTSRRHGGYGHPPVQMYDSPAVWINNRVLEGGALIPKVTGSEGNYSIPATSLQHASIHVSRLNNGASHSSRPKPRKPAFLDDFLLPKR
ncbi:hypothetical protein CcCBS67573_g07568 [Chytriomyces confervae]|uniref:Sfi1 spindle body domain-containing protein n=1 Tax=Chytriomyces confervae TaxID=246404 RepID=A0A507EVM8_9FUNG|nr:hypothetical protein CcCBS67573_g07568 [Chytriomyces confervae]